MAHPEPLFDQLSELIRTLSADTRQRAARRRKQIRRLVRKVVRTFLLLTFTTFVFVGGMIASGLSFGAPSVGQVLAAIFGWFSACLAILYFSFRRRATPPRLVKENVAQLPAHTEEWLEAQRRKLPYAAQQRVESILLRLEVLTPQLQSLPSDSAAASEARRLLGEELPELVRGYQKVPAAFRGQAVHGGKSPNQQLLDGLETVDAEMHQLHARLAADDLRALATQQRYLELKYKREGDLE